MRIAFALTSLAGAALILPTLPVDATAGPGSPTYRPPERASQPSYLAVAFESRWLPEAGPPAAFDIGQTSTGILSLEPFCSSISHGFCSASGFPNTCSVETSGVCSAIEGSCSAKEEGACSAITAGDGNAFCSARGDSYFCSSLTGGVSFCSALGENATCSAVAGSGNFCSTDWPQTGGQCSAFGPNTPPENCSTLGPNPEPPACSTQVPGEILPCGP